MAEERKEFGALGVRRNRDGESDENLLSGKCIKGPIGGGLGAVGLDFLSSVWVVAFSEAGEKQLQVIIELGEGADG